MPSQSKTTKPVTVPVFLPDNDASSTTARSGSPSRSSKTKKHGKKGHRKGSKSDKKHGSSVDHNAGFDVAYAGAQFD